MNILEDVRALVEAVIVSNRVKTPYKPIILEMKLLEYFKHVAKHFGIIIDGYEVDSYFQVPMVIDRLRELGVIDTETWLKLLDFMMFLDGIPYKRATKKDIEAMGDYFE